MEDDLKRSEERLATTTQKLAEASLAAKESEKICRVLKSKIITEEDRAVVVEQQPAQVGIAIDIEEAFC